MDLDGDGIKDIVSGSWPGEIFFFKGKGGGQFADRVKILGKDGLPLNISGGVKETENEILITGDGEFSEDTDGKSIVTYNGKKYKSTEKKDVMCTGCASAVAVADWNGDGLLDLIVGDIRGRVGVYINTGTAKKYEFDRPVFLKSAMGRDQDETIMVHGDAGPCVADWDGDGLLDLIVGAGDGSVTFYRNTGTAKEPKLAEPVTLVPTSEGTRSETLAKPMCGTRSKVCVADWNGDGKPDLILGDFAMTKPEPRKLTAEEEKTIAEAKKRHDALMSDYSENSRKIFGPKRLKDSADRKKVAGVMKEMREELTKLSKIIPREYEQQGWVWVFERKEMPGKVSAGK